MPLHNKLGSKPDWLHTTIVINTMIFSVLFVWIVVGKIQTEFFEMQRIMDRNESGIGIDGSVLQQWYPQPCSIRYMHYLDLQIEHNEVHTDIDKKTMTLTTPSAGKLRYVGQGFVKGLAVNLWRLEQFGFLKVHTPAIPEYKDTITPTCKHPMP